MTRIDDRVFRLGLVLCCGRGGPFRRATRLFTFSLAARPPRGERALFLAPHSWLVIGEASSRKKSPGAPAPLYWLLKIIAWPAAARAEGTGDEGNWRVIFKAALVKTWPIAPPQRSERRPVDRNEPANPTTTRRSLCLYITHELRRSLRSILF